MHFLALTIICSSSIAIILKINSNKDGNSLLLLTGNYLAASIISLVLFFVDTNTTYSTDLIPLGLFLSLLFVGSIFAFSKSVSLSGAALSTVSSRLSVFVPIILSIIFFSDLPNTYQVFGLILTLVTIIFFYFSIKNNKSKEHGSNKFFYLISILLGIGVADFFMKVFLENWATSDKPWFLFWIFFFSLLITVSLTIKNKVQFNKSTLLLGIIMGIPNIFSSYFLIEALSSYSAVFVYPFVNISIIIFTSIIVKVIWKEEWNSYSKLALIVGALSIALLSL